MEHGIFEYKDINETNNLFNSYHSLQSENSEGTALAILFRLLLGTLSVNYDDETYNQTQNFFIIGAPIFARNHFDQIIIRLFNQEEDGMDTTELRIRRINELFFGRIAEINSDRIYNQMLHEFSMGFLKLENSPLACFVHLYRLLESISYCFPLLYLSASNDFKGTYAYLKEFLTEGKGELKFFESFQKKILNYDENVEAQIEISVLSHSLIQFIHALCQQEKNNNIFIDIPNSLIRMTYKDIIGFSISIRNRFFHGKSGGRDNFYSNKYDPNDLFELINPYLINMISYIFSRILETHATFFI